VSLTGVAGSVVLWAALLAAIAGTLAPRTLGVAWSLAPLLLATWLGLTGTPLPALALAAGVTTAVFVDRREPGPGAEFGATIRALAAVALGLGGAIYLLVRIVHAELVLVTAALPGLAAGLIALAVVALATDDLEQLRAARLVLVAAAVALFAGVPSADPWTAALVGLGLPLLAVAGRMRPAASA
jgi:hypothetical protein